MSSDLMSPGRAPAPAAGDEGATDPKTNSSCDRMSNKILGLVEFLHENPSLRKVLGSVRRGWLNSRGFLSDKNTTSSFSYDTYYENQMMKTSPTSYDYSAAELKQQEQNALQILHSLLPACRRLSRMVPSQDEEITPSAWHKILQLHADEWEESLQYEMVYLRKAEWSGSGWDSTSKVDDPSVVESSSLSPASEQSEAGGKACGSGREQLEESSTLQGHDLDEAKSSTPIIQPPPPAKAKAVDLRGAHFTDDTDELFFVEKQKKPQPDRDRKMGQISLRARSTTTSSATVTERTSKQPQKHDEHAPPVDVDRSHSPEDGGGKGNVKNTAVNSVKEKHELQQGTGEQLHRGSVPCAAQKNKKTAKTRQGKNGKHQRNEAAPTKARSAPPTAVAVEELREEDVNDVERSKKPERGTHKISSAEEAGGSELVEDQRDDDKEHTRIDCRNFPSKTVAELLDLLQNDKVTRVDNSCPGYTMEVDGKQFLKPFNKDELVALQEAKRRRRLKLDQKQASQVLKPELKSSARKDVDPDDLSNERKMKSAATAQHQGNSKSSETRTTKATTGRWSTSKDEEDTSFLTAKSSKATDNKSSEVEQIARNSKKMGVDGKISLQPSETDAPGLSTSATKFLQLKLLNPKHFDPSKTRAQIQQLISEGKIRTQKKDDGTSNTGDHCEEQETVTGYVLDYISSAGIQKTRLRPFSVSELEIYLALVESSKSRETKKANAKQETSQASEDKKLVPARGRGAAMLSSSSALSASSSSQKAAPAAGTRTSSKTAKRTRTKAKGPVKQPEVSLADLEKQYAEELRELEQRNDTRCRERIENLRQFLKDMRAVRMYE
ncbi:unnamed protein product [Amoebophrya sp. A120]|nr:unnamed protein product [Amoebophrya sp. A120]|eukprot:GSA120T00006857001.1